MYRNYSETEKQEFANTFNEILDEIKKNTNYHVYGKYTGCLCPYMQFVTIDCLDKKDWPNGIDLNSIYFKFTLYLDANKIEFTQCGHVWLSPKDLQTEKYKYLAMKSIANVAEDKGVKKFRKQGFKSAEQCTKKILEYVNKVMECVTEYTGGYPYKEGIEK